MGAKASPSFEGRIRNGFSDADTVKVKLPSVSVVEARTDPPGLISTTTTFAIPLPAPSLTRPVILKIARCFAGALEGRSASVGSEFEGVVGADEVGEGALTGDSEGVAVGVGSGVGAGVSVGVVSGVAVGVASGVGCGVSSGVGAGVLAGTSGDAAGVAPGSAVG